LPTTFFVIVMQSSSMFFRRGRLVSATLLFGLTSVAAARRSIHTASLNSHAQGNQTLRHDALPRPLELASHQVCEDTAPPRRCRAWRSTGLCSKKKTHPFTRKCQKTCGACQAQTSNAQFSVLTYNVWGDPRIDDKPHVLSSIRIRKSMEALIAKVEELNPWVVSLQEYNGRVFDGPLKPFWKKYKACKILKKGVVLTVRNDVNCRASVIEDFDKLRQCDQWSRQYQSVQIQVDGSWIEVAGLHLRSRAGREAHMCRGASLGQSFTNVIQTKRRGVVMGDMNWYCSGRNGPDIIHWERIRHFDKFFDAFWNDTRVSFPSWEQDLSKPKAPSSCKLDRIFFTRRGLKVVSHDLVNKRIAHDHNIREKYQFLSDHLGLFAVFEVVRLPAAFKSSRPKWGRRKLDVRSPRHIKSVPGFRSDSARSHLKAGRHSVQESASQAEPELEINEEYNDEAEPETETPSDESDAQVSDADNAIEASSDEGDVPDNNADNAIETASDDSDDSDAADSNGNSNSETPKKRKKKKKKSTGSAPVRRYSETDLLNDPDLDDWDVLSDDDLVGYGEQSSHVDQEEKPKAVDAASSTTTTTSSPSTATTSTHLSSVCFAVLLALFAIGSSLDA